MLNTLELLAWSWLCGASVQTNAYDKIDFKVSIIIHGLEVPAVNSISVRIRLISEQSRNKTLEKSVRIVK